MLFGLASIAPNLVPWYLGTEFLPVTGAIIVISPIIVTIAFSSISGTQYITATNQIKIITSSYTYAAVINLLINIILIPKIGFYGASIGTLVAELICVIIQYYYLSKQMKLNGLIYQVLKYLIVSIFMCIPVLVIGYHFEAKISTTIIQIFVGLIVYISILILLKDKFINEIKNKILLYLYKR